MRHANLLLAPLALTLGLTLASPIPAAAQTETVTAQRSNDSGVVRTMVYHDITANTEKINTFYANSAPQLSADGSTGVFSIDRADGPDESVRGHVYIIPFAGGEPTEVDVTTASPALDISDDGSRVLSWFQPTPGGPRQVRIADRGGARLIVEEQSVSLSDAVLTGDGQKVFFTLNRDSILTGLDGTAPGGLWEINADGSGLRHLVGAEEVRSLIDAAPEDIIFFAGYPLHLDASADGDRVVFEASNYSQGATYLLGVEPGGAPHVVVGPVSIVQRAAISGDGSKVLAYTIPAPFGSAPGEFAVSSFDGSDRRVLVADNVAGGVTEKGVQLSFDGSLALIGSSGLLYDTADGTVIDLAVWGGCGGHGLAIEPLAAMTMDGDGRRFLFLTSDYHAVAPLSTMELDPDNGGAAPTIAEPAIEPAFVAVNQGSTATVRAVVEGEAPIVCATVLRDGVSDYFNHFHAYTLADDGVNCGDKIAGDGLYTCEGVYTFTAVPGPRTMRFKAEIIDAAGMRHATVVDVEPFEVR